MTLKITGAVRLHAAPCQHYEITVNDNGVTRKKVFNLTELDAVFDLFDQFPGGARGALILAWVIDRRARGASLAQLANVEIESIIV